MASVILVPISVRSLEFATTASFAQGAVAQKHANLGKTMPARYA
jgi:hypothetical protein